MNQSASLSLCSLSVHHNQTAEGAAAERERLWLAHIRPEGPRTVSSVAPHLQPPAGPAVSLQPSSSTTITAPQRALSIHTTHADTHTCAHTYTGKCAQFNTSQTHQHISIDIHSVQTHACTDLHTHRNLYVNSQYAHKQTCVHHRHKPKRPLTHTIYRHTH